MVLSLKQYDIHIGAASAALAELLKVTDYSQLVVIVDENTMEHCLPLIRPCLPEDFLMLSIPPGELHKNIDSCQKIWSAMISRQLDRNALVLNLGGGVIGDMGGFCAATYKRGIRFIQIPTTLLAQVDASVGGKLGIDFSGLKNSIGSFANPTAVLVDSTFLNSLPERQIRSGFAEVIKHALIADAHQWELILKLQKIENLDWQAWLERSIPIKREIVELDPFEKNVRKKLNFGHTIGHAVESELLETSHPMLHGEAVAWGMMAETALSAKVGLDSGQMRSIIELIARLYEPRILESELLDRLIPHMKNDKKNISDQINFTMLKAPGEALIDQTASESEILQAINDINSILADIQQ